MAKSFLASKTFWAVVATFVLNGLGAISGMIANHPEAAVIVNAVMGVLTIFARSVATQPLSVTGSK